MLGVDKFMADVGWWESCLEEGEVLMGHKKMRAFSLSGEAATQEDLVFGCVDPGTLEVAHGRKGILAVPADGKGGE